MGEKKYRIRIFVPLGKREAILFLNEKKGILSGWLEAFGTSEKLSGKLSQKGEISLSGKMKTLVSTFSYTADGFVSGKNILLNLKTKSGVYSASGEEISSDE